MILVASNTRHPHYTRKSRATLLRRFLLRERSFLPSTASEEAHSIIGTRLFLNQEKKLFVDRWVVGGSWPTKRIIDIKTLNSLEDQNGCLRSSCRYHHVGWKNVAKQAIPQSRGPSNGRE